MKVALLVLESASARPEGNTKGGGKNSLLDDSDFNNLELVESSDALIGEQFLDRERRQAEEGVATEAGDEPEAATPPVEVSTAAGLSTDSPVPSTETADDVTTPHTLLSTDNSASPTEGIITSTQESVFTTDSTASTTESSDEGKKKKKGKGKGKKKGKGKGKNKKKKKQSSEESESKESKESKESNEQELYKDENTGGERF
ncbi:Protein of unknown function [Gryllus bimaculatus]|nr:Protein of unknown function [Gryllus bimaculatus]